MEGQSLDVEQREGKAGRYLGILALLVATVIWGSTFVMTQSVLGQAGPFTVTALRFLFGLAVLCPFAYRQGFQAKLTVKPTFLAFGLTGVALYFGLQNLGLVFTSAGNAALIQAGIPAATAIISFIFLKERIPLRRLVGMTLAIAGVALVSSTPGTVSGGRPVLGNLLIVGSVFAYGAYTVQGRCLRNQHYAATVTTSASFVTGLFLLIPVAVIEMCLTGLPKISLTGWLTLIYLGVIGSGLTLFLWNYALRFVEATVAGLYVNLIPVVGLAFAWLGGEHVHVVQLIGGGMAIIGVLIGDVVVGQRSSGEVRKE
ncbi:DMT family transporter [Alicyclobacillus shizuokensis]|uniref:DMT family transporter n=1 Tax=Alicyclobacillus shizuokensis TaxID=392014 RepID=UPI000832BB22|nr:EamA family transporter [Alicyclobacillus shizuokensis]MCL6625347.1 EamA family transporter [Alicyclobacillus shizuokensis]